LSSSIRHSFFSELGDTKDNIPQLAHVDMKESVNNFEEDCLGIKSCIAFAPVNPDGMMLQVWTEGKSKKYCNVAEVMADEERIEKDKDPKPGQYVLYIPHGVMIAIPGDTVHAGGFCFGRKLPCPSRVPGKEIFLQNHLLHFIFCCTELAFKDCKKETSIQIVGDDEPPFLRDYAPDEEVLNSLLESVLDCHSDFIPIAAYNNPTRPSRKRKRKNLIKLYSDDSDENA